MLQKVALAGALIHDPELIILDEPLTGLDAGAARQVKDVLIGKVRAGATIVMTTHILDVAERMAERIGVIAKGRVVAEGSAGRVAGPRRHGRLDARRRLSRPRCRRGRRLMRFAAGSVPWFFAVEFRLQWRELWRGFSRGSGSRRIMALAFLAIIAAGMHMLCPFPDRALGGGGRCPDRTNAGHPHRRSQFLCRHVAVPGHRSR